jgi:hypothetical protein
LPWGSWASETPESAAPIKATPSTKEADFRYEFMAIFADDLK